MTHIFKGKWITDTEFYNLEPRNIFHNQPSVKHYKTLEDLGYDQIPCGSTWLEPTCNLRTMSFAKTHLNDEKLLGFMSASWHLTIPEMMYGIMHDAMCQKVAIEKYYSKDK